MTPESPKVDSSSVKWLREWIANKDSRGIYVLKGFRLAADELEQALIQHEADKLRIGTLEESIGGCARKVAEQKAELERVTKERDAMRKALGQIRDWHWPGHEYRYGSDEVIRIAQEALK